MQNSKSKIKSQRTGGVRTRLFGTRKSQKNTQPQTIIVRKPLLYFHFLGLEVAIYRIYRPGFSRR